MLRCYKHKKAAPHKQLDIPLEVQINAPELQLMITIVNECGFSQECFMLGRVICNTKYYFFLTRVIQQETFCWRPQSSILLMLQKVLLPVK